MKKILVLFGVLLLFTSCMTLSAPSFVLTGDYYEPLAPDARVKVVMNDNIPEYDEIGIIVIEEVTNVSVSLETVIEEVKIKARANGGDVIILDKLKEETAAFGAGGDLFIYTPKEYLFIVGKLK